MQRIIFLDIDGPVIPNGCFAVDKHASLNRVFSPVCIHLVQALAFAADAKIVTNSSHNFEHNYHSGTELKRDLCQAGLDEHLFHDQWRTQYPAFRRMQAIVEWQHKNGLASWLAFDDEKFTHDKRLIWIDPDEGITVKHYNRAAQQWNLLQFWVL